MLKFNACIIATLTAILSTIIVVVTYIKPLGVNLRPRDRSQGAIWLANCLDNPA